MGDSSVDKIKVSKTSKQSVNEKESVNPELSKANSSTKKAEQKMDVDEETKETSKSLPKNCPFRVCVGNVSTGKGRGRGRPAPKFKEKTLSKPQSIEKICEGFEEFSSLDPSATKTKNV